VTHEAITSSELDPPTRVKTPFAHITAWDRLCAVAAIAALVAAILPWTVHNGASVRGIQGDGQFSMLCAVVGLATLALHRNLDPVPLVRRLTLAAQSTTAALVLFVGAVNLTLLSTAAAIGVYLTLLAGLVWLVGAALGWRTPAPTPLEEQWL